MTTTTWTVSGMSCGHCVAAVTEELMRLAAVRDVTVDLGRGRVALTSDGDVDEQQVRAAVEEAGYELVGAA